MQTACIKWALVTAKLLSAWNKHLREVMRESMKNLYRGPVHPYRAADWLHSGWSDRHEAYTNLDLYISLYVHIVRSLSADLQHASSAHWVSLPSISGSNKITDWRPFPRAVTVIFKSWIHFLKTVPSTIYRQYKTVNEKCWHSSNPF